MDIPFFQSNSQDAWGVSFTKANQDGRIALQGAMSDTLISFVRTLDPNPARSYLPTWPQFNHEGRGRQAMTFDADLHRARLSITTTEETVARLAPDIDAARAAYPKACNVFELFSLEASVPPPKTTPPTPSCP
jgi:hypothetical protein